MIKRSVAITGMGAISPIGNTLDDILANIKKSYCGIDYIKSYDTTNSAVKLAAEIKNLDIEKYLDKKSIRRMDRVNILGLIASMIALEDSKINMNEIDKNKFGTIVSTGIGGLDTLQKETEKDMIIYLHFLYLW